MAPKRRSIGDRNKAAIAHDTDQQSVQPALEPEAETVEPTTQRATTKPKAKKGTPTPKKTTVKVTDTSRIGIYLSTQEFADAKAAYLAAWDLGGQSDTFAQWIGTILDAHASRTPAQRTKHARMKERSKDGATGSSRSFDIPTGTVSRMRAAITADQWAGRWPTDSEWAGDAIAVAVKTTRAAKGGTLPAPPTRLPNRLRR